MSEDDIPTLGYAPGPPRSMTKAISIAIGGTGIAVTVAGILYWAVEARPLSLPGRVAVRTVTWQTQPAGGLPTAEPATDSTTQPSADTSIQHTATAQ